MSGKFLPVIFLEFSEELSPDALINVFVVNVNDDLSELLSPHLFFHSLS